MIKYDYKYTIIVPTVHLKDWLHHIEDQEKNSEEGVTYEETLSSDEEEGMEID